MTDECLRVIGEGSEAHLVIGSQALIIQRIIIVQDQQWFDVVLLEDLHIRIKMAKGVGSLRCLNLRPRGIISNQRGSHSEHRRKRGVTPQAPQPPDRDRRRDRELDHGEREVRLAIVDDAELEQ